jgi:signal transduction histidine kinase
MIKNNRITQSVIIGLTTLVATAAWAGLENILSKTGSWVWPSFGFFILLIFLSLNWLLTKSKAILLITLFFILISFFFSFGLKLEYLAVFFVAFLLFYFGSQRAIDEKEARIKIGVVKILRRGLPFILTGLSLIIATAYYFSPLALTGQNEIIIPRPLFDRVIEPIIVRFEQQLPINQISKQFGISLEKEAGIANQELKDNLYQSLNQEINRQSQAYKQYFPLGLAAGLFFALKAIGIPFMWLIILLSWLIFKILVSLGAIKIQEQAVLKEVIEV